MYELSRICPHALFSSFYVRLGTSTQESSQPGAQPVNAAVADDPSHFLAGLGLQLNCDGPVLQPMKI